MTLIIDDRPAPRPAALIEAGLRSALAEAAKSGPPTLAEALEYAVFPGGARIRPRLALAVAHAGECDEPDLAQGFACSLELLHCASLVHDDLPCFDDAGVRRGRPSLHRVFGEPLALLAGDALIVLAFEVAAKAGARRPGRLPGLVRLLAGSAGPAHGLVAGQAWESEASIPLERYHQAKTGSLFVAATVGGALAAGRDPGPWRAPGEFLGQAYQVADDLFDAHGSEDAGGKPVDQDSTHLRPSAVSSLGTAGAVERLRGLVAQSAASIPGCPGASQLRAMVVQMAERLVPSHLRQTAA